MIFLSNAICADVVCGLLWKLKYISGIAELGLVFSGRNKLRSSWTSFTSLSSVPLEYLTVL